MGFQWKAEMPGSLRVKKRCKNRRRQWGGWRALMSTIFGWSLCAKTCKDRGRSFVNFGFQPFISIYALQSLIVFHVLNRRIRIYLTMITSSNTGSNSPLFSLDRSFRSSTSILQLSTMQQEDSSSKEAAFWDVRIVGWLIMLDGCLNGLVVWWGCWDCILVPYFPFLVGGRKGCFGKEPLSEFETVCCLWHVMTRDINPKIFQWFHVILRLPGRQASLFFTMPLEYDHSTQKAVRNIWNLMELLLPRLSIWPKDGGANTSVAIGRSSGKSPSNCRPLVYIWYICNII